MPHSARFSGFSIEVKQPERSEDLTWLTDKSLEHLLHRQEINFLAHR